MVKRVLLFSNQKNCSLTKAIIKERGKWDYPRDRNLSEKEEERKKSTSILAKRNQESTVSFQPKTSIFEMLPPTKKVFGSHTDLVFSSSGGEGKAFGTLQYG